MKNYIVLVCVLLLLFIVVLSGCSLQSKATAYTGERNSLWVEDMEFLQNQLPIKHANLYSKIAKEEFHAKMEKLKKDIPYINDDEVQIRLMEILAPVQDAHLFIMNFESDLMKLFSAETFFNITLESSMDYVVPIKAKWFGDELIVTEAHSDYKEVLGAKLERINNKPVEAVIEKINTLIPHNNEHRLKFLNVMHLSHPQVLRHFGILKNESLTMEFTNADGRIIKKNIKVMNIRDVNFVSVVDNIEKKPLYMTKDDLYWYEYLPESKTVYFRLGTYGIMKLPNKRDFNEGTDEKSGGEVEDFSSFYSFLENMLAFMEVNKPEKLVIDLRGNNGGNSSILSSLRDYIGQNPLLGQKGRVFLLVDRGSFSAPILECTRYKEKLKAIVVGEPTGERPFLSGGAQVLQLPNSKLSILYAIQEFKPIDKNIDTVIPDITVIPSFEDYKSGTDAILKAALDYPAE